MTAPAIQPIADRHQRQGRMHREETAPKVSVATQTESSSSSLRLTRLDGRPPKDDVKPRTAAAVNGVAHSLHESVGGKGVAVSTSARASPTAGSGEGSSGDCIARTATCHAYDEYYDDGPEFSVRGSSGSSGSSFRTSWSGCGSEGACSEESSCFQDLRSSMSRPSSSASSFCFRSTAPDNSRPTSANHPAPTGRSAWRAATQHTRVQPLGHQDSDAGQQSQREAASAQARPEPELDGRPIGRQHVDEPIEPPGQIADKDMPPSDSDVPSRALDCRSEVDLPVDAEGLHSDSGSCSESDEELDPCFTEALSWRPMRATGGAAMSRESADESRAICSQTQLPSQHSCTAGDEDALQSRHSDHAHLLPTNTVQEPHAAAAPSPHLDRMEHLDDHGIGARASRDVATASEGAEAVGDVGRWVGALDSEARARDAKDAPRQRQDKDPHKHKGERQRLRQDAGHDRPLRNTEHAEGGSSVSGVGQEGGDKAWSKPTRFRRMADFLHSRRHHHTSTDRSPSSSRPPHVPPPPQQTAEPDRHQSQPEPPRSEPSSHTLPSSASGGRTGASGAAMIRVSSNADELPHGPESSPFHRYPYGSRELFQSSPGPQYLPSLAASRSTSPAFSFPATKRHLQHTHPSDVSARDAAHGGPAPGQYDPQLTLTKTTATSSSFSGPYDRLPGTELHTCCLADVSMSQVGTMRSLHPGPGPAYDTTNDAARASCGKSFPNDDRARHLAFPSTVISPGPSRYTADLTATLRRPPHYTLHGDGSRNRTRAALANAHFVYSPGPIYHPSHRLTKHCDPAYGFGSEARYDNRLDASPGPVYNPDASLIHRTFPAFSWSAQSALQPPDPEAHLQHQPQLVAPHSDQKRRRRRARRAKSNTDGSREQSCPTDGDEEQEGTHNAQPLLSQPRCDRPVQTLLTPLVREQLQLTRGTHPAARFTFDNV